MQCHTSKKAFSTLKIFNAEILFVHSFKLGKQATKF